MNNKAISIALGHQARVGKDSFAERLQSTRGCEIVTFASPLYEITEFIQKTLGMDVKKDPALLQLIGEGLRNHYSRDVFVDVAVDKILTLVGKNPSTNIIVTDMRYPNEMKALTECGFKTVKITRSLRPIDRDPNHISEVALKDEKFDFTLSNEGTLEDFNYIVDNFLALNF